MVWVFSLSAECGAEQSAAEHFAQHFDGLPCTISGGIQCHCRTGIFEDVEGNWWCSVYPGNVSHTGINTPEDAYLMTELGILLYQRLKSAPPFRYALVGVEVDEFRTYSELIAEIPTLHLPGLVLTENIWRSIGASPRFPPFSPGYVWHPYEGETYKPLMTSPELKQKLNALLTK